jgi:hypothetical protein
LLTRRRGSRQSDRATDRLRNVDPDLPRSSRRTDISAMPNRQRRDDESAVVGMRGYFRSLGAGPCHRWLQSPVDPTSELQEAHQQYNQQRRQCPPSGPSDVRKHESPQVRVHKTLFASTDGSGIDSGARSAKCAPRVLAMARRSIGDCICCAAKSSFDCKSDKRQLDGYTRRFERFFHSARSCPERAFSG